VDAIKCAVQIQTDLTARNTELLENRQLLFRIGINLGDVVQEGDHLFGEKKFRGEMSRKASTTTTCFLVINAVELSGWNAYLQQCKYPRPLGADIYC
jgi:hypothetical protein